MVFSQCASIIFATWDCPEDSFVRWQGQPHRAANFQVYIEWPTPSVALGSIAATDIRPTRAPASAGKASSGSRHLGGGVDADLSHIDWNFTAGEFT
jgi:hypothetical protein